MINSHIMVILWSMVILWLSHDQQWSMVILWLFHDQQWSYGHLMINSDLMVVLWSTIYDQLSSYNHFMMNSDLMIKTVILWSSYDQQWSYHQLMINSDLMIVLWSVLFTATCGVQCQWEFWLMPSHNFPDQPTLNKELPWTMVCVSLLVVWAILAWKWLNKNVWNSTILLPSVN